MDLSVVVSVYNGEESVESLIQEVNLVLQPLGKSYELIMVDDGSTDGTYRILCRLHKEDPRVKIVRFKRNFGHTATVAAGFAYARGGVIVAMDGDGENDPKDIPPLLEKLEEGFDLVSGWRLSQQDPSWSRKLPSLIANRLISWLTRVKLHDHCCTLKAIRCEVAKELKLYGEMHRFISVIAYERGARIAEIEVHHRAHRWGKSKDGIAGTFHIILDLLTVKFFLSYATRPLHIFGLVGLLSGGIGFLIGIYLTVQKLFYQLDIGGRPLLLLAVLLVVTSFQFITMGLFGEMLARTYHETQNKPIYVIKEILG